MLNEKLIGREASAPRVDRGIADIDDIETKRNKAFVSRLRKVELSMTFPLPKALDEVKESQQAISPERTPGDETAASLSGFAN